MTDEEMAAIRERSNISMIDVGVTLHDEIATWREYFLVADVDRRALLAEVERLRKREAKLDEVVRVVALGDGAGSAIEFDPWGVIYAEDVVAKARALLERKD